MSITHDFIAGVISLNGTFYHTATAKNDQFGFQIKAPCETFQLINEIGIKMGLSHAPKKYGRLAILHTRSAKEIAKKIIPFCDDRLYGQKLIQYIRWKQEFLKKYDALEKNA